MCLVVRSWRGAVGEERLERIEGEVVQAVFWKAVFWNGCEGG